MGQFAGEIAALATAFCWSLTAVFFTAASRRIGSFYVNMIRIPMAIFMIGTVVYITTGKLFPTHASNYQMILLAISGIAGLVLGDSFLFRSLVILGPRLATLIFASWPLMTAVMSWFFLSEKLGIMAVSGIVVAFIGIAWVTAERQSEWKLKEGDLDAGPKALGIAFAILGALGQAVGLVIAKHAMADTLTPIEASMIRMVASCAVIWIYSSLIGKAARALRSMKKRDAMLYTLGGAIAGPFLGIWMSLIAVRHTETGVAAAIMASVPVVIIPVSIFVYHQYPSARAVIGALITVGGIVLLFLR